MPKTKALVVANRTLESPELLSTLNAMSAESELELTVLVPAVPRGLDWVADMKAGKPEAIFRARRGAQRLRFAGLDVRTAIVGDPDPFAAVCDALRDDDYEAMVISTFPHGISRWLHLSLPDRIRRVTSVPIVRVTAHRAESHRALRPRRLAEVSR
jgi:hypothetical protein